MTLTRLFFLITALAAAADAQLFDGTLLLSSDRGVFRFDPTTGQTTTLLRTRSGQEARNVVMGPANNHAAVLLVERGRNESSIAILTQTPNDSRRYPGQSNDLLLDQDGHFVVTRQDTLARVDQLGRVTTLVSGLGDGAPAVCLDGESGDWLISQTIAGRGHVLRRDGRSGRSSTLFFGPEPMTALAFDPWLGGHYVATATFLQRSNRVGNPVDFLPLAGMDALRVDGVGGRVFCSLGDDVLELAPNLGLRRTLQPNVGRITGIEIWRSRKIAPARFLFPTRPLTVHLLFRESPSARYVCALGASGMGPGINIAGSRRLNINPDPLFFATAANEAPLFTRNFVGVLDGIGGAQASFYVPEGSATLRVMHFVAAAVNPTKPGNLDVSETMTIRLR